MATDLDGLAAVLEQEGVSVRDLLACVSRATAEMVEAMDAHDEVAGEGATSAFLNSLGLLPLELRKGIAEACLDRSLMHPRLFPLAL